MKKSQKGFTLVELIVVIAIIGVLAAILVPSMMGYVKKSRLKTANTNAKLVYTTCANVSQELETQGLQPASAITIKKDVASMVASKPASKAADASNFEYEIRKALADNGTASGWAAAKIKTDGSVEKTQWAKTATDNMIGQYPNPCEDVDNISTISRIS